MFTDTLHDFAFFLHFLPVFFPRPLLLRNALDADEIFPWMAAKMAVCVCVSLAHLHRWVCVFAGLQIVHLLIHVLSFASNATAQPLFARVSTSTLFPLFTAVTSNRNRLSSGTSASRHRIKSSNFLDLCLRNWQRGGFINIVLTINCTSQKYFLSIYCFKYYFVCSFKKMANVSMHLFP